MNRIIRYLPTAALAVYTTSAMAAADTDISTAVTTVSDTWSAIKTVLLAIGTFLVAYAFFKRVRRA